MPAQHYLARCLLYRQPTSHDQARMPQRRIAPAPTPVPLARGPRLSLDNLPVIPRAGASTVPLAGLLSGTGTTAFVVLHRGRIVWELDPDGATSRVPQRCFSVTKSFASALVGVAIAEGAIGSAEQAIGTCLPGLRDASVASLSLDHLLRMRSGVAFREGIWPWLDAPRTYYGHDLRRRALACRIEDPVGAFFHYNDWHPFLLALVIERATGRSVTSFLQEKVWDAIGAEDPACTMVDRDDAEGIEHLESGLSASARDLAKFGQLVLDGGEARSGRAVIPRGWLQSSTTAAPECGDPEWWRYYRGRPWGRVFAGGRTDYAAMWWGHTPRHGVRDVFAMGVLGQHVYVSSDTQVVIVRLSDRFPPGTWWAPVLRQVAEAAAS